MKTSKIQCGYRSNDIYTGEDYLIHDIIEYETDELQNTDILDYSEDQHGVTTHQELLEALSSHFKQPVDTLYGFWLARTIQDVLDVYADNEDPSVLEYDINESLVVISDLGDEGALYVSTKPLNSYTHIEVDLGRILNKRI